MNFNFKIQPFQTEMVVYTKLPRGFHIPTPVGKYSPDWAIAFKEGTVTHIFFIAETKGTMDSMNIRPIERAKILCARRLFNEISTSKVKYHDVDSYQSLLDVMGSLGAEAYSSTLLSWLNNWLQYEDT
jgi:type III restriction enzyme